MSAPALVLLSGCGGESGDKGASEYEVTGVNIVAHGVAIGGTVRTEVLFDTKQELDGSADGLDVLVKLPPAVEYVEGSSRIYNGDANVTDKLDPTESELCANGTTSLVFRLSRSDLRDRELSGTSFGLSFEVLGVWTDSGAAIAARADEHADLNCRGFDAEKEASVKVM
jgi:hypothetical protein